MMPGTFSAGSSSRLCTMLPAAMTDPSLSVMESPDNIVTRVSKIIARLSALTAISANPLTFFERSDKEVISWLTIQHKLLDRRFIKHRPREEQPNNVGSRHPKEIGRA